MAGLLDGIRVVEFAAHGVGPLAGLVLTQYGAEVLKIEHPVNGDPTRGYTRAGLLKVPPGGHTVVFEFTNRNKKSVTIDVSKDKGREIFFKLIKGADAFHSNYLPRSLKKLGFDYESLAKHNPRLVYATSSSYGKYGPDSNKSIFDAMAIARSGLMLSAGEPDDPPTEIRGTVADCAGGTFLAFGIIGGLLMRERTGKGQEIDSSLLGPLIWLQQWNVSSYLMGGEGMKRESRASVHNPIHNNYKCKDGRWLKLTAYQSEDFWPEFCRVFGLEKLEKDPRYDSVEKREKNSASLVKLLDDMFITRTISEWTDFLKAREAGIMWEVIQDVPELGNDPQALANHYIEEEDHPTLGHIKSVRFPIHFGEAPQVPVLKPAPLLGQHTEEIMLGLGYSRSEIAVLKNDKVI